MPFKPPSNLKSFNLFEYTCEIYQANLKTLLLLAVVSTLPRFFYKMLRVLPLGITVTRGTDLLIEICLWLWIEIAILGIIIITKPAYETRPFLVSSKRLNLSYQISSVWLPPCSSSLCKAC